MTSVSELLKRCEADAHEADVLVQRAQAALDAAVRRALVARGKVEGVKAAQQVACGD